MKAAVPGFFNWHIVGAMNSLRARILVTLVLLALTLVASTVWFTREAFQRGFLDYLNMQTRQRMETSAQVVGAYHEERGGFDRLRREPGLWIGLLGDRSRDFFVPRGDAPSQQGGPPDPADIQLALVDAQDRWVAGRRFDENSLSRSALRVPVRSNDSVVGYVVAPRMPRFEAQLDRSFVAGQQRIVLFIGLTALVVSLPFGLLIASRILSPVKQLTRGVGDLSDGNYGVRLQIDRKDELGKLSELFNQLSQTLAANRSAQQRWIADISHELRTPVAVLEAELEAIEDGVRRADEAQVASLLNEVRRLSRLINDLYELSRSDSGDLSYQMSRLDLVELVQRTAQTFEARVAQASLEFQVQLPSDSLFVNADEARLYQLLGNLLENSCRYTDAGGKLILSADRDEEGRVVLEVQDSSPAVQEEELPRLFDRLYRVESSRSRETGGSGLGLSICRNIALAHGAKLDASLSALGGLCVRLTLPPAKEQSQ